MKNKKLGAAQQAASEPVEEPLAYFLRREQAIPLSRFVVERVIELAKESYTQFVSHLHAEHNFIRENKTVMYRDANRVWHCLLVKAKGERSGILIEAEGLPYARYTAYCPDGEAAVFGAWSGEGDRLAELWPHDCRKTYLAKFSIREGEHEYGAAFLVQAESLEEATTIAKSQYGSAI